MTTHYQHILLSALSLMFYLATSFTQLTAQNQIPVKTHTPVNLNQASPRPEYSYYVYLPKDYYTKDKHPILINFPGLGQWGLSDGSQLDKVLKYGPARLIENNIWDKQGPFLNQPFIVITPQSWSSRGFFGPDNIKRFLEDMVAAYKVDTDRIYFTGLSGGAIGSFEYFAKHGTSQVAAAVLIAGDGSIISGKNEPCSKFENTAVWAFHGSADRDVLPTGSIRPVQYINNNCRSGNQEKWRLTIYPGVGHNAWTRTYDLSGINSNTDSNYDPYNENIYQWLLRHSKGGTSTNQPPVARAGADVSLQLPTNQIQLKGSASSDPDGSIATYAWSKTSGPSGVTLSGQNTVSLTASNLTQGSYTFQLRVTDNQGASDTDQVQVTVTATPPSSAETVWLEAECAAVASSGSFWTQRSDTNASGGRLLEANTAYDGGTGIPFADPRRQVQFTFTLSQAGNYHLLARHTLPSGNGSAFVVKVNEGSWQNWNTSQSGSLAWQQVLGKTFALSAGQNTITFVNRNLGAQLDKLAISLAGALPSGKGSTATNCANSLRSATQLDKASRKTEGISLFPELEVYPNPSDHSTTLRFTQSQPFGSIWLTDLSGKVIRHWEQALAEGTGELRIDTHDIPAGYYLLRGDTPALRPIKLFIEH